MQTMSQMNSRLVNGKKTIEHEKSLQRRADQTEVDNLKSACIDSEHKTSDVRIPFRRPISEANV